MEKKELIEQIKKEILGIPQYGFEDEEIWGTFKQKYFFRSGEINGEKYSSQTNMVLSSAALSHVLDEIRKRLDELDGIEQR